jgi:hypothetical protein
MQRAGNMSGLVASILVIGLLAAVLVAACPQGVHPVSAKIADPACAVMKHSSVASAVLGSDSGRTLVASAVAGAATPSLFALSLESSARLTRTVTTPGSPVDPLHGRLRI